MKFVLRRITTSSGSACTVLNERSVNSDVFTFPGHSSFTEISQILRPSLQLYDMIIFHEADNIDSVDIEKTELTRGDIHAKFQHRCSPSRDSSVKCNFYAKTTSRKDLYKLHFAQENEESE